MSKKNTCHEFSVDLGRVLDKLDWPWDCLILNAGGADDGETGRVDDHAVTRDDSRPSHVTANDNWCCGFAAKLANLALASS